MIKKIFSRKEIVLVLMLALVLRMIGILARPLWYDEAFSILFAEKGLQAMLVGTLAPTGAGSADIHPLGYYLLLWGWMKFFGQTLWVVRLLSVLLGVGSVWLGYQIILDLFRRKTALLAAFFLAISPFQIHYGQEVRMYALLTFWLLVAFYAFLRVIRANERHWLIIFALAAALAQYTHHLAAFFLLPLALTVLLSKDWDALKRVFLAGGAAILLYLPWLLQLPAQLSKVQTSYWVEKPGAERLVTLLLSYVTNLPLTELQLLPALFCTFFLLSIGVLQTFRSPFSREGFVLFFMAFSPPLALFVFSQWVPVFIERALIPSGAIFLLWLAWVLSETKLPHPIFLTAMGLIIAAASIGIYQHRTYKGFPYAPYRELTQYLAKKQDEDALILHSNKLSVLPAVYEARHLPQSYLADQKGGTDTLALATQKVLGLLAEPDLQTVTQDRQKIYFLIFKESIEEYQQAGYETHPHLAWLQTHYRFIEIEVWDSLLVYRFEVKDD